ncbi:TonB-dependent receptor [Porticoccaceae bacterium LTM1]|nr:TonB-dependent receptor [Porticoccaceae bacterium LTM1]
MSIRKLGNRTKTLNIFAALPLCVAIHQASASDLGQKINFDIKSQSLDTALLKLSEQSNIQLIMDSSALGNINSKGLLGSMTIENALRGLLKGTGLTYSFEGETVKIITDDKDENAGNEHVKDVKEVEELVVTGSRIVRASSQVAANVLTLDAEALRGTGQSTLEGALRQLPQNIFGASEVGATAAGSGMSFNGALNITGGSSINLRGLGSESTLVLIDGRRIGKSGLFGGIADISGIPLNSVARVEIMLDAASAIYGSDAVGGVVNIILKKDYEGAEITFEYGTPEAGGFGEHILTMSGGTSWDSGRVRATIEHFQRSNLDGNERPERIATSYFSSPAYITAFSPLFYQYNGENYLASELAGLGLNPSSPGVEAIRYSQLPASQNGSNLLVDDFVGLTAYPEDPEAEDGISLIPSQKRSTVQVGFDQALPWGEGDVTLSGSLYYSDRQTYAANGAFTFAARFYEFDDANPLPFEGSGTSTNSVFWRIPGLADKHFESDQEVWRWSLGLDGEMGGSWRWNMSTGQSRDRIDSQYINDSITSDVYYSDEVLDYFRSIGYTEDYIENQLDYRFTNLIDSGLNVFASDILENDSALLAQLVAGQKDILAINQENSFEASVNGALFDLPGGEVHLALGVDWRQEILETASSTSVYQSGFESNYSLPTDGYDKVEVRRVQQSAFAELLLPLVGADNSVTGIERLNLTGAARYDSYSDFGGDSTWSLGMIWNPVEQVTVKANQSTSYVVPTPREVLVDPEIRNYPELLPWFTNGVPQYLRDENGAYTGEVDFLGMDIFGGNPDLQPETASSQTVGLEVKPETIAGLTLGATWHRTTYNNRIGPAPIPVFTSGTDYVSKYRNVTRDEEKGWLIVDYRAINNAQVEISGVDYHVRYDRETDVGQFIFTANVGYTGKYERVEVTGDEPINVVADVNFRSHNVIPAYRYSANLGWYNGGWSANINANTSSKTVSSDQREGAGDRTQRIAKAALKTDLVLAYDTEQGGGMDIPDWLKNTVVTFKIMNLFDDHPEFEIKDLTTGEPYPLPALNANLADPRGRMFHLGVTKRF